MLETSAELIYQCRKALKAGDLLDPRTLRVQHLEIETFGIDAALRIFLHAVKEEAALSAFGAIITRWDILQRLANLRRFCDEERQDPEIVAEAINAPIIITGLPRSGTTFLQNLLAEDPDNRVLRAWQVIYPYADTRRPFAQDKRPSRFDRQIRCFNLLSPDLHKVHPLNGCSLQECTEVTAHVFQSLRFDTTYRVPSYRRWLDGHGYLAAYQFHKRFLQHLQHQGGGRRWVLKAPDHVFALEALQAVYPNARIVFIHRDPAKVLPSNAQLTEILRSPFTRRIDPIEIGQQNMDDLSLGAANMVEASRHEVFPPGQVFHLHFLDLIARPMDAVGRLYRHFRIAMKPSAAERIACTIAAKPNGGYAKNVYRPNRHGIDADEVRLRFHRYVEYFDIARESTVQPAAAKERKYVPAAMESLRHAGL